VSDARPRRRAAVAAALLVVVALALLSRRYPLPGVFAEHTGDALYATAAYFLFALCSPGARPSRLAAGAFAFAAAIECAQLLTWPWLEAIRSTRVGALLLGQGFQVADLVAYACGAIAASVADVTFHRRSIPAAPTPDSIPRRSTEPHP
jgi:hypothetical protein